MRKNYNKIIILLLIIFCCVLYASEAYAEIRKSVAHNIFYSDDPNILKAQIQNFFKVSDSIINKDANISIIPHGWYKYAGYITAKALNSIERDFDTVIIIAESHDKEFKEVALSPVLYKTPLGQITLAKYKSQKIIQNIKTAVYFPKAHRDEYGIEVVLPFFQFLKKDFKIIPIILSQQIKKEELERLSVVLASIWDSRTIIVGSVNIFTKETAGKIENYVKKIDNKFKLYDFITTSENICGRNSLFVTILTAQLLGYYQFNFDFENIPSSEFGYTGAVFTTIH